MSRSVLLRLAVFLLLVLLALPACTSDRGSTNVAPANTSDKSGDAENLPAAVVSYAAKLGAESGTAGLEAGPGPWFAAGPGPAGPDGEPGPNAAPGPGPNLGSGAGLGPGPGGPGTNSGAGDGAGPGPANAAGPGPQAGFGPGPNCQAEGDCDPVDGGFGPGPNLEAGPGPDANLGPGPGCSDCPGQTLEELTESDRAALYYMREEEKLAGDVYDLFYAQWGRQLFANIAQSEETHETSVLKSMALYGLEDTAAGNAPGVFNDPALQTLYDQMVARGSTSESEAMRVGATIEEVDILDLYLRLGQTTNPNLIQTFTNLLSGSENHLRAFVRTLAQDTGEIYEPQYLDPATYEAIIGADGFPGGKGNGPGGN